MIKVPSDLLAGTFAIFRDCGHASHECVAYWLSPTELPSVIDEVIHPDHTWTEGGYQIDDNWLTAFWFDLARRKKSVRVQVHTHPRLAFHSATDDEWALVHTPGFLSLVIPDYAIGSIALSGAYLAERRRNGWRKVRVDSHLRTV